MSGPREHRLAEDADSASLVGFVIRYEVDGEPHEMPVDNELTAFVRPGG